MAAVDAPFENEPLESKPNRIGAWARWWLAGTPLDWGYVVLSGVLIATAYHFSWLNRNTFPLPDWANIPSQLAWLAITAYLAGAGFLTWRRDHRLLSLVPEGYELSAAGCAVFLVGILFNDRWTDIVGVSYGVPAIFRLPNLLEIAGGVLIVVGPLRAGASRGELTVGPTALFSAVFLLAAVTFFTQFDHPYIDQYASTAIALPGLQSPFDRFNNREEILGALGLLMQTVSVVSVVVWTIRQSRLPVGSLTLMLTTTAFLTATQLSHWSMVWVGLTVGVLADIALFAIRPRADRVLSLHLFALLLGALLAGVYLIDIGLNPGTWWPTDMTYGTVLSCAIVGGLISYVLFPGSDATRAASVLWPALSVESSPGSPDVTVERVEHALRVLHNTRDLADNPLTGMRCLAAHTPGELRKTLEAAIEHLRTSQFQQDAQAGQILDLYYVRRIGGHYAVTMRVGLSRAAYFNRRSYGVRRLVDRLRELEETAATA